MAHEILKIIESPLPYSKQGSTDRKEKMEKLFPPGLEPGTFRVLGERDNHYTTETWILESLYLISCKSD